MFLTPETPRSALRRGSRWFSYFNLPVSVTAPFWTMALRPDCEPAPERSRRLID